MRGLYDVRQRLPRHGHPGRGPARVQGRGGGRGLRRYRARPRAGRGDRRDALRAHHQVRRGAGAEGPRAGLLRDLRRPAPLQGLRRLRGRLPRAGLRRAAHDRQGARRGGHGRGHPGPLRARHALLPPAAPDAARVPQREGAGRPHARRARPGLRRRGRLVRPLRRGPGHPPARGGGAARGGATAIRMRVGATRQVHGPESMGIVAATGCNTVYGSTYPFNPFLVPWTNSLFENAPADALGIRERWDQAGHPGRRLWVLGGDGAMYDIGFQSLSRMVAAGADIKVLVLDTGVYSNTGGQASTASFGGQVTKLSAFGAELRGRSERRKELGRILVAHGEAYVAQPTPAHVNHFYRAIMEANAYPGPAVIIAYTPCQPEHGIGDEAAMRQAKLAVDSRAFPLFTYDPPPGASIPQRLSPTGTPAPRAARAKSPDGSVVDFLAFARTEGRFAPHFGAEGAPTAEILATQADRLANWRTLQELAGLR